MYGYDEYINLSPDQILQKLTQQEIFEFGLSAKTGISVKFDFAERYRSPFRLDKKPGCRFEERGDGTILFVDFGEKHVTGRTHRTCFSVIMDAFNCSLRNAIEIICNHFGISKVESDYNHVVTPTYSSLNDKTFVNINYTKRATGYNRSDILEWSRFLIRPEELLSDNVFSIRSFSVVKEGITKYISTYRHAYAIDFVTRVKIYQPHSENFRFITNCDEDCIGNIDNLPLQGDILIITKSYKDHRIIRNLFPEYSVIWFQNEGCVPSLDILKNLTTRFRKIIFFYDNDESGIAASHKLVDIFNNLLPGCASSIIIPHNRHNAKDPGEFINKEGRKDTVEMLKQIGL